MSLAMDGVQRYIANVDDPSADEVERADTALAAPDVKSLSAGTVEQMYIYTTNTVAVEEAETVLASEDTETFSRL